MKKIRFLSTLPTFAQAARATARATGLAAYRTGRRFQRLAARALDAVQDVLRAEVENGNLRLVADFLADKALPAARALLIERMSVRLLARLGLRGALASNVVGWIIPFVIEGLLRVALKTGLVEKIQTNTTVAESLLKLDELRRATWKLLVPDPGTGAEWVEETTSTEPLRLPAPAAQAD